MADINKILIIEDSEDVVEAISVALQIRWPKLEIISTGKGEGGIDHVKNNSFDMVILDLGLIDISGFEVLKRIRLFSNIPIMILSVRGDEADIIKGLELGADEYIVKPFRQLELISRIKAITRRLNRENIEEPIIVGNIHFDSNNRIVSIGEKQVALTQTENDILFKLIKNKNIVVTHNKIAEHIWGTSYPEVASSIKVYIRRLREKIEPEPSYPRLIITKPGLGYLFAEPI